MRNFTRRIGCTLAAMLGMIGAAQAVAALDPPAWTHPAMPFTIVGPISYVGTEGLAAYLIKTDAGLILLDGTMAQNVPSIEANIRSLGYRLSDVKLLLNTHAHFDHAAGLARLKRDTGATFMASAAEKPALESGKPPSDTNYGLVRFPPVKVDRVLADGPALHLGGVAMIPILTPGHTPGCTTWTMAVQDRGRARRVIFPCSISVGGNILVGNKGYPGIVGDYRRTFARMRTLHADIVLPAHAELADIWGREQRLRAGDADAFIAPDLLPKLVDEAEKAFNAELAKQQSAARTKDR